MSENNLETRTVIVVGKTGVGKSKICNKILNEVKHFRVAKITESFTDEISYHVKEVAFKHESGDIPFMLKVFDTPGLDDSRGRSKQFLNEIALTILKEPLNMIIVIVEYEKFSTSIQNNLEVLRECLNDLSQSSSMLIINKVPLETILKKKLNEGEVVPDREKVLEETFEKYSKALGCSFKYQFFLENHDYDDDINEKRYNAIKEVIFNCSSFIDTANVRTWDQVVETYEKDRSSVSEQELNESMSKEAAYITDKLSKIEFDIADIKYPFLNSKNKIATLFNEHKVFVESFKCEMSKENYLQKKNFNWKKVAMDVSASVSVGGSIVASIGEVGASIGEVGASIGLALDPVVGAVGIAFGLINLGYKAGKKLATTYISCQNITENLAKLGDKRAELIEELSECQGSFDKQKKRLEERKAKIISLESALVIQNTNF
jgi:GTPase SAR1 family protein